MKWQKSVGINTTISKKKSPFTGTVIMGEGVDLGNSVVAAIWGNLGQPQILTLLV